VKGRDVIASSLGGVPKEIQDGFREMFNITKNRKYQKLANFG
jgi:hypothetical protein